MSDVNVLSLQFAPVKLDKQANLDKVVELIKKDGKDRYDLIVLPEFFDMGINMTNKQFFENAEVEKNSLVLEFLTQIAQKYNSYVHCGSILFKEKDKCLNRAYLLGRDGSIVAKYDKIHLFNYFGGNEGSYTYPGEKLCVVETDFGKVGLATCFDLRFAEMFTKLMKLGAELFIVPAAWSVSNKASLDYRQQFIENWRTITQSRAYDNVAFIVTANESGNIHPMFEGIGNSMIVSFDGKVLASAGENEAAISAQLDFNALRDARKSFPITSLN